MPSFQFPITHDFTQDDLDKMSRGVTPKGGRRVRYTEDGEEILGPVVEDEDGDPDD